MNYFWTVCPSCSCQIAIQFSETPDALTGSVRRWSSDRSVNDGRRLDVPRAGVSADGAFRALCPCGAALEVSPAGIEKATTERPA